MKSAYLEGRLKHYLARRSPPQFMAKNDTAQAEEVAALVRAVGRAAPDSGYQEWWPRLEDALDRDLKTRAWPNVHEIMEAARKVGGRSEEAGRGDRAKLSYDNLKALDDEILPRARKWLSIPGLAEHGRATLDYWGEEIDNAR